MGASIWRRTRAFPIFYFQFLISALVAMPAKSHTALPVPAAAVAFRPDYLDFRRGIHVGNLEDNERITRILKLALESRYAQPFVTERWGRGVYWQWIGYLPRANREAMPLSSHVSFGCSKFFISVDTEEKLFKCGMQVERGYRESAARLPRVPIAVRLGLAPAAGRTPTAQPHGARTPTPGAARRFYAPRRQLGKRGRGL